MSIFSNKNESSRQAWLAKVLSGFPDGLRILDAGAGELKNKSHCSHLDYVSQDFCQYKGNTATDDGIGPSQWDTSRIDLVCDITQIPVPDASFDVVLCSEVLEHIPEPTHALDEFSRLLKPEGVLILTAPFASNVHMAPYHFCSGFSRYWYDYHLPLRGLWIKELTPNGDWYSLLIQEITRLGGMERSQGNWAWPLAYAYALLGVAYFHLRRRITAHDLACFGWHCIAVKQATE